jgi:hypothetical protein
MDLIADVESCRDPAADEGAIGQVGRERRRAALVSLPGLQDVLAAGAEPRLSESPRARPPVLA